VSLGCARLRIRPPRIPGGRCECLSSWPRTGAACRARARALCGMQKAWVSWRPLGDGGRTRRSAAAMGPLAAPAMSASSSYRLLTPASRASCLVIGKTPCGSSASVPHLLVRSRSAASPPPAAGWSRCGPPRRRRRACLLAPAVGDQMELGHADDLAAPDVDDLEAGRSGLLPVTGRRAAGRIGIGAVLDERARCRDDLDPVLACVLFVLVRSRPLKPPSLLQVPSREDHPRSFPRPS